MMRAARLAGGLTCGLLLASWLVVVDRAEAQQASPTSAASTPTAFTKNRGTFHAIFGYGFLTSRATMRNPYNASVGAQGGYTLTNGLYVGVMADYFIGDSEIISGTSRDLIRVTYDWSHMAAELGYDVAANALVLRPSLSIGAAINGSCADTFCTAKTYLLLAPTVTGLAPLGRHSFFSFTLRYFYVPGGDTNPLDGVMFGTGLGASF